MYLRVRPLRRQAVLTPQPPIPRARGSNAPPSLRGRSPKHVIASEAKQSMEKGRTEKIVING